MISMDTKKIHVAGFSLIFLVIAASRIFATTSMQETIYYVSGFGFLALLSLIFVIAIPLFVKYLRSSFTAYLMANRRWIGIYVFIFALLHVLAVYNSLFGWDINAIVNGPNAPFLALGSLAFLILASMTATSNDASVRILGRRWKKLHMLVYVALALILVHSYNIGLVFMSNDAVALGVIAIAVIIVALKLRMTLAARFGAQPKQPL